MFGVFKEKKFKRPYAIFLLSARYLTLATFNEPTKRKEAYQITNNMLHATNFRFSVQQATASIKEFINEAGKYVGMSEAAGSTDNDT